MTRIKFSERDAKVPGALLAGVMSLLFLGCAECKVDSDCPDEEICRKEKCVVDDSTDSDEGTDGDTDTSPEPTESDPPDDTDSDTLPVVDGGPDTTGDTASGGRDSESTPQDTDSRPCTATLTPGEACADNCQCVSGHCGDGFCCDDGECCGDADDCDETLCTQYYCSGNHQCMYSTSVFECGSQDDAGGDECNGALRCDGYGNCVEPGTPDCAPYAAADTFSCQDGVVEADCFDSCTAENEGTHCAADATCFGSSCRSLEGLENGESCQADDECRSNHCGDGFCCNADECCASTEDCDNTLCTSRTCTDNRCRYTTADFQCGTQDVVDGDTCDGAGLCNGQGACISANLCTGAYAPSGTFVCAEDSVVEACYTSCINITHCQTGFRCESEVCVPGILNNGEICLADTDCRSGHCGDGFCCTDGECCAEDADCDDTLCNDRFCDPTGRCDYSDTTACGFEDTALGDTCEGDNRCDGSGNCVAVTPCPGAYAIDGTYTCGDGTVTEDCNTQCVNLDDCNPGYFCDTPDCVSLGPLPNGAACGDNTDCDSNHCEGGICCTAGECCATIDDCDNSLCTRRACGNFTCVYHTIGTCGTADTIDGDTCTGDTRCDGLGACVDVAGCDGAYAFNGSYQCAAGSVRETCFTSCTGNAECNSGYACIDTTCTAKLLDGEGPCTTGAQCESGYCTPGTGICCEDGLCCSNDNDCGDYTCNTATWSCAITCDTGGGDDNTLCDGLGNFHCDNGACRQDIDDGEGPCDENSDCLSAYCDLVSGFCCDGGSCCGNDDDCEGFSCGTDAHCETDCSPSGTEEDSLCAPDYHCEGDVCVADIPNGGGGCIEDSDCASANCTEATGVCCASGDGDCCNSPSQCDDGNECTRDLCSLAYQCYTAPQGEGESCSDGEFCNGAEQCDNVGTCVAASVPCSDAPANTCDETTCYDCAETTCDEVNDACVDAPINEGQPCTDPLFCIGGISQVCQNGLCVDPGTGTVPCTADTGNPCTDNQCNESTDGCDEAPKADGFDCDDGNPCTGDNRCIDGVCAEGAMLPCDDGDPCTIDGCTPNGDTADCDPPSAVMDGQPCDNPSPCFGDSPVCYLGECIPDATHPCQDAFGICTIQECNPLDLGGVECEDAISNTPSEIFCNATTSFSDTRIFRTREYYEYNATCPGSYDGMEAVLLLDWDVAGNVDISVTGVSPAMDIDIFLLSDWCDAGSCAAHGTNSLSADIPATGTFIVLEASEPLPPDSLDVVVGSCPQ